MTKSKLRINPFFSFINWFRILISGRLRNPADFKGSVINTPLGSFEVFKSIYIRHRRRKRAGKKESSLSDGFLEGEAVFQISFKASYSSVESVIGKTGLTIPFFCGLPGFRSKHFMINRETGTFSGLYRWDTVLDARNYVRSFAVKIMKKQSHPWPVKYIITDLRDTKTIEENTI